MFEIPNNVEVRIFCSWNCGNAADGEVTVVTEDKTELALPVCETCLKTYFGDLTNHITLDTIE